MALSRRSSNRFQNAIWPGFVDAMTGLLLVLMFVLTIFMVIQFVLRETDHRAGNRADALSNEVAALTATLGLARDTQCGAYRRSGCRQRRSRRGRPGRIAALIAERGRTGSGAGAGAKPDHRIRGAGRGALERTPRRRLANIAGLEAEQQRLMTQQEALNLALAQARERNRRRRRGRPTCRRPARSAGSAGGRSGNRE